MHEDVNYGIKHPQKTKWRRSASQIVTPLKNRFAIAENKKENQKNSSHEGMKRDMQGQRSYSLEKYQQHREDGENVKQTKSLREKQN